jgi:hypothetical protein
LEKSLSFSKILSFLRSNLGQMAGRAAGTIGDHPKGRNSCGESWNYCHKFQSHFCRLILRRHHIEIVWVYYFKCMCLLYILRADFKLHHLKVKIQSPLI